MTEFLRPLPISGSTPIGQHLPKQCVVRKEHNILCVVGHVYGCRRQLLPLFMIPNIEHGL